ncbi:hypothetical protein I4U23_017454 [Adineta vaga]|nr:hypothetical protein I4U23_017454 [Adineta vaga]
MDIALEFCLKRFVDDQVSDSIKQITQLERNLERKRTYGAETSQHDNDVLYQRESLLGKQFFHDLNENNLIINQTRQIIEEEFFHALQTMRNEIENIAQISSTRNENRENIEEIRSGITKIRQQISRIDSELAHLFQIIDSYNFHDHSSRIFQWFRQHYGYANEINRMIGKYNESGITTVFSQQNLLTQTIMKCVNHWNRRRKLLEQFIHEMDEDSILSKHIMDSLYRTTDSTTSRNFIEYYIENRQERRFHREEYFIERIEEELEEQCKEQQRRIIELINALCQLSINITNEFQLNKKFRKIFHQINLSNQVLPILIDQNEKEENRLLIIRLNGDYKQWISKTNSISQRFCLNLSVLMKLPEETFTVERIEQASSIILYINIHPTYNQVISKQLENESSVLIIQAIKDCSTKFDCQVYSIVLGEHTLTIEKRLMDLMWDTIHTTNSGIIPYDHVVDSSNLNDEDSFHSEGWKRFPLKLVDTNIKWNSWRLAYHGSRGFYAPFLLTSGMRVSTQQCQIKRNQQTIHLSPSLEYSAHPRFTYLWRKLTNEGDKYQYYQLVFQCRINPDVLDEARCETLLDETAKIKQIDKNISNDKLEWIIQSNIASQEFIRRNFICCGLMIRMIEGEPKDLPLLNWWNDTHYTE